MGEAREMESATGTDPVLEVRDLRTTFRLRSGDIHAVDGVSFEIGAGETLGLVGESGSGKSMTALSILGLVPHPGEIEAGGSIRFRRKESDPVELIGAPEGMLRSLRGNRIAMIFQEPMTSLNPVHRVGHQIDEVLRLHIGLKGAEARARSIELLGEVGVPEPEARYRAYPHELSGGMRQRVMIAMALACEPDLLIADEPTTALDVTIQAQILDLLKGLQARHGMAILLITHDLGVVAEVCSRVLIMYGGQLVESGAVQDLFADPRHPYTRGLVDSLPRPDGAALIPIPGRVPAAGEWSSGCRFAPRCRWRTEVCAAPQPLIELSGRGRATRCVRVGREGLTLDGDR